MIMRLLHVKDSMKIKMIKGMIGATKRGKEKMKIQLGKLIDE